MAIVHTLVAAPSPASPVARFMLGAVLTVAIVGVLQVGVAPPLLARTSVGTKAPATAALFPTGSFAPLVEKVSPAVVNITTVSLMPVGVGIPPQHQFPDEKSMNEFLQRFFGGSPGENVEGPETGGAGSGFIIDPSGYIVTNNHVVEGASEITVTLESGKQIKARLVGRDEQTDLALLKVDSDQPLPFVELGDSDAARVGDWVLAVGNPFGLGGTVTAGIISARGRDIHSGPYDDYLQVDAPINRGNSGGPLFDGEGMVVGINAAIYSPTGGSVGIGFAIPSNLAKPVLASLRSTGRVERGFIGVNVQSIDDELAASLGLDSAEGALVAGLLGNGPAMRAGIQVGDIIVSFDGESIKAMRDLPRHVAVLKPGKRAEVVVLREGKRQQLSLEVVRMMSSELASSDGSPSSPGDESARLGVMLSDLSEQARQQRRLDDGANGVLIAQVAPGSPAALSGLRSGDLIVRVGRIEVNTARAAAKAIEAAYKHDVKSVVLLVHRDGDARFVAVQFKKG